MRKVPTSLYVTPLLLAWKRGSVVRGVDADAAEALPLPLLCAVDDAAAEEPDPEEEPLVVSIEPPVEAIVAEIVARLGVEGPRPS